MLTVLILCAAFLHALWNTLVKTSSSSFLQIALLQVFGGLIALIFIPGTWLPAPEARGYLLATIGIHFAYYILLSSSYRFGELSLVYPIARGSGPALVAFLSPWLVGEHLSSLGLCGLTLLCGGVVATGYSKTPAPQHGKAVVFAMLTGITIAAYTIVDGLGSRASGEPMQFIRSLYIGEAIVCIIAVLFYDRKRALTFAVQNWKVGLFNACVASLAYGIVIWAMTYSPMAYVAALRETSVVFAVAIGALVLKESYGRRRIIASLVVVCGAVLLHW